MGLAGIRLIRLGHLRPSGRRRQAAIQFFFEDLTIFPVGTTEFDSALLMHGIAATWQAEKPLAATTAGPASAPDLLWLPSDEPTFEANEGLRVVGDPDVRFAPVKLYNLTFDAHDPSGLAAFWSAVLERPISEGANEFFATIARTATAPAMLFIRVPETKKAKNRLHIDLDCDDLGAARDSLEGLGATFIHEKDEFGVHWMTFQDPEGNEFCVAAHG